MKFFRLSVIAVAALAFNACEKQPYSKIESMESIHHHHGHGHGDGGDHKEGDKADGKSHGH